MTAPKRAASSFGFQSFIKRLEVSARKRSDYPAATPQKLNKDFQRAFKTFQQIRLDAHSIKLLSNDCAETLKVLEASRVDESISELLTAIEQSQSEVVVRLEDLESLVRKSRRLHARLVALKLTVTVTQAPPVVGLPTLITRVDALTEQLIQLTQTTNAQEAQLKQLSDLANWSLPVAIAKEHVAAGFSEIGAKALFSVAYGIEAPRVTRRSALAALAKWASSNDRAELAETFTNHRVFTSTKRTLDKVKDLNFVAHDSAQKQLDPADRVDDYFILLESLRIDTGLQSADNLLWVANFVGNLEASVFGDSAEHEVQLAWINKSLEASGYSPLSLSPGAGPSLNRISVDPAPALAVGELPLVSVIMPAFNSEKWISTAIQSLLAQTWTALEIFVVDDCSTDATYSIAKSFEAIDHRVRVLRAKTNSGPYHCRNLALNQATGTFVTVHDADDWSHPQKIETQVRHLAANPSLMANVSEGARLDETSLITGLTGRSHILRPNYSSLMFRREPVMEALGFWDEVRFGGDSEFQLRLISRFGAESFTIVKTGLLSLLRVVEGSLTAGGMQEMLTGARKLYKESFVKWHNHLVESGESFYLDPTQPRRFYAPRESLNQATEIEERNILIVADFSQAFAELDSVMQIVHEALNAALSVSFAHVPSIGKPTAKPSAELEYFALNNDIDMVWHLSQEFGENAEVRVNQTFAVSSCLQAKYDRLPQIASAENILVVSDASDFGAHEMDTLTRNYNSMIGGQPKVLTFGEQALTAVRDLKFMVEISDGKPSSAGAIRPNSKSER